MVDSLKALDPNRPIREADMCSALAHICFGPKADIRRVSALHPPLRRCFQHFLKFLLVELGVARGEMATGLFACRD